MTIRFRIRCGSNVRVVHVSALNEFVYLWSRYVQEVGCCFLTAAFWIVLLAISVPRSYSTVGLEKDDLRLEKHAFCSGALQTIFVLKTHALHTCDVKQSQG